MANNNLLASDSFQRPGENPLSDGGNWTNLIGASSLKIIAGNLVEATVSNTNCGVRYSGIAWSADQISEVTVQAANTTNIIVPIVRASASAQTYYQANLSPGSTSTIYRTVNGVSTSIASASTPAVPAGTIVSLLAVGALVALFVNSKLVCAANDLTITSGSPGFLIFDSGSNLNACQISAWRGYGTVQTDGVWTKKGVVVPPIATDIGQTITNGTQNPYIIFEGNAKVLSTSNSVFKMWFSSGQALGYAESLDGINWTRYPSYLLSGFGQCPSVIKNGSTYYLFTQAYGNGIFTIYRYTSSDGITWANKTTVFDKAVSGWDSGGIYYFSPIYIDQNTGTWYALYNGFLTSSNPNTLNTGLATSPDGLTWTRYTGNPVVSNYWGVVLPYKIGNTWYNWGQSCNPGQGSTQSAIDPGECQRMQTTDLINWTNRTSSVHHSQLFEGVNGVGGGAYPCFVIQVGGQAYMYITSSVSEEVTHPLFQIELATAPASVQQLVQFKEDATSQIASDNFNRANGSLGANWTTPTGGTALQIASNLCEPTVTGTRCIECFTGTSFNADQYSEVTISSLSASSFMSPVVRCQTGSVSCYSATIGGATGSSQTVNLNVISSGVATQLGPTVTMTPVVGDVIRLQVVGNIISLFQNGYLLLQFQDNNNTLASGSPGVLLNAATAVTNAQASLWAGGNANVLPVYQTLVQAFGNPVTTPVNFGNQVTTPVNFGNPAPPSTFGNPVTTPVNFGNVMSQINGIWYCIPRSGTQN